MLNDYYYGKIVKCTQRYSCSMSISNMHSLTILPEVEEQLVEVKNSVFKRKFNGLDYEYCDVTDGKIYEQAKYKNCFEGESYIDTRSGLIPLMNYLKYIGASKKERYEWGRYILSYEKLEKLLKRKSKLENDVYKLNDKIKVLIKNK